MQSTNSSTKWSLEGIPWGWAEVNPHPWITYGVIMSTKDVTDLMVCKAYAEAERQRETNPPRMTLFGREGWGDYEFPYIILQRMTGECEKVCYRAMERACDRDLIEFGVSLRTGWLTDKGRKLLQESLDV